MSTRSVDDLVAALGIDAGISKSEVSRICKRLDEHVDAFRNRSLGHTAFPYVYLDATYVNVRDSALGQVVLKAIVIVTGITACGDREVLGLAAGDSESEAFWGEFCRSLRRRGLGGVRLVISDAHEGLKAAIRKHFTGTSWQRCRVHFAHNLLQRVPKGHQDMVAAAFRMVFMHPDATTVTTAWDDTTKLLSKQFPKVVRSQSRWPRPRFSRPHHRVRLYQIAQPNPRPETVTRQSLATRTGRNARRRELAVRRRSRG